MTDEAPKTVSYRLLIPFQGKLRKAGQIMIRTFEGDILYTPSQGIRIKNGKAHGTIDHVSFHKSDREDNVSVKFRDIERKVLQKRLPIQEIGYQIMFEDAIFDVASLPEQIKKVNDIDLIFDPITDNSVRLRLLIISGRLIIEPNSIEGVSISQDSIEENNDLLSIRMRCVGRHSGNADKLMEFSLSPCKNSQWKKSIIKRSLAIPNCQGIRRPNF